MSSLSTPADNTEAAARVYRQLQQAVCGNADVQARPGGDRRAIAVLAHVMKPQNYRLPVVSAHPPMHGLHGVRTWQRTDDRRARLVETSISRTALQAVGGKMCP